MARDISSQLRTDRPPQTGPGSQAICACTALTGLTVEQEHYSGSRREATAVYIDDAKSDTDTMYQLGPVQVLQPTQDWPHTADGLVLRQRPSEHAGFVLLECRPLPGCWHKEPLLLSGGRVVELMKEATLIYRTTTSGPAATTGLNDYVACLHGPQWPSQQ